MTAPDSPPRIASARPELTAALMAETGLDEDILCNLVHRFYARVREDGMLGPIFAAHIKDWGPHLDRMVDFWSSVALMTGRYHGAPVPAHAPLPVTWDHFTRWLALFRQTAGEVCPPAGAVHVGDEDVPDGLSALLRRLIGEMEVHMKNEERILFPAIRRGGGPGIGNPIAVMRADHDDHDRELAEIRRLTADLTLPKGACRAWTALYEGLAEFVTDLENHIRLENDVLFPPFEEAARHG